MNDGEEFKVVPPAEQLSRNSVSGTPECRSTWGFMFLALLLVVFAGAYFLVPDLKARLKDLLARSRQNV